MPEFMFYIGIFGFVVFCAVAIPSIVAIRRCWKRAGQRLGNHDIYGGE